MISIIAQNIKIMAMETVIYNNYNSRTMRHIYKIRLTPICFYNKKRLIKMVSFKLNEIRVLQLIKTNFNSMNII